LKTLPKHLFLLSANWLKADSLSGPTEVNVSQG